MIPAGPDKLIGPNARRMQATSNVAVVGLEAEVQALQANARQMYMQAVREVLRTRPMIALAPDRWIERGVRQIPET